MQEARERLTVLQKQLKELEIHRRAYEHKYRNLPTILKPGFQLLRQLRQRLRPDGTHGSEQSKLFDSDYKYDPHGYGRAKAKLQAAASEYYVFLGSVSDYCSLNMAGFEKSVRKLDQELGVNYHNKYINERLRKKRFSTSYTITRLQQETEELFAKQLSRKPKKEIAHELRATVRPNPPHPLAVGRGGIMLGLGVALGAFGIYSGELKYHLQLRAVANRVDIQLRLKRRESAYRRTKRVGLFHKSDLSKLSLTLPVVPVLQIYSAFFLPILLAFTVGIDLYIWDMSKINVSLIFSFDRRTHIHRQQYYELPAFFFLTLTTCIFLTFTCTSVSPTIWPLVWLASTVALFVCPLKILHYHARWWLVRTTFRVFASGILQVEVSLSSETQFCRDVLMQTSSEISGLGTSSAPYTTLFITWDVSETILPCSESSRARSRLTTYTYSAMIIGSICMRIQASLQQRRRRRLRHEQYLDIAVPGMSSVLLSFRTFLQAVL
jgi:hypothetical protein